MASTLPLAEYFPLLVYLSLMLTVSFVSLPHSTTYLTGSLAQSVSSDRPEHRFLTPITARPVVTLLWNVLGSGVIMVWWGGKLRGWWDGKGVAGAGAGAGAGVVGEEEMNKRRARTADLAKRLKEAGAATLGGAAIYHLFLTLMGAPLNRRVPAPKTSMPTDEPALSHVPHTALLALHLSILTVWPVVYCLGIPSLYDPGILARYRLTRIFCQFQPENAMERALAYPVFGTVLGAWIGAVPLALDWDRPWQRYPLTIVFASILGFGAGGFASWAHSVAEGMFEEVRITEQRPGQVGKGVEKKRNRKKKRGV